MTSANGVRFGRGDADAVHSPHARKKSNGGTLGTYQSAAG